LSCAVAAGQVSALAQTGADGGYPGEWLENLRPDCAIEIEIVQDGTGQRGFKVIPWRWVVERTFAWLSAYRRFSKDYKDYKYLMVSGDAMDLCR
jgi:hypothetical protein